ncbi:unnamed protein product, partial [Coregonus sp. 'balchen']
IASSPSLLLPVSVSGLVAALSISLIILLVLFCKRNKDDVAAEPRDVTYADVRITQDPEPRRRREKSPGDDPVYSAVKTSNTTGVSGPGDVIYADVNHTEKRQHNRRRENVVPDPIYSAVKTDRPRYRSEGHSRHCLLRQTDRQTDRDTGQKVVPDPVYSDRQTDRDTGQEVVPDPVYSDRQTDRQRYSDPVHQNVMVGGKRCSLQLR